MKFKFRTIEKYNRTFHIFSETTPSSTNTLIHLYRVSKEYSSVSRTHVLRLQMKNDILFAVLTTIIQFLNNVCK